MEPERGQRGWSSLCVKLLLQLLWGRSAAPPMPMSCSTCSTGCARGAMRRWLDEQTDERSRVLGSDVLYTLEEGTQWR